MSNNYMYAIDRSDEYLTHYGIKGMKWGVRKAVERGNARALNRHFMKAQRKLARLKKHAENKAKYARRAKMLGAGAVATGGLTVGGVGAVDKALGVIGRTGHKAINAVIKPGFRNDRGQKFSEYITGKRHQLNDWARTKPYEARANKAADKYLADTRHRIYGPVLDGTAPAGETYRERAAEYARATKNADKMRKMGQINRAQMFRAGTALATAGLAAGAGYNAYRAATADRAARKANEWERAMKDTFGTTGMSNKKSRSKRNNRR